MFGRRYKQLVLFTALSVMIVFLAGCGMVRVNPEVDNKTVVAKISGVEIKKEEFNRIFDIFKVQYEQQYGTEIWDQEYEGRKFGEVSREKLLDMMIDEKLQLKKAEELAITVSDEELNNEIENAKKYFDTEEKFNEFLKGQGIDQEYLKDSYKRELTIKKLTDKLTENISVTDQEIEAYYNTHQDEFVSVKASHILLDTREEAEKILQRVKTGEDFAKLAKECSKDPTAKENSGDLDYFRRGDVVEPFEEAAFALKPGEISEIVQTDFGFHIIKVEDNKLDKFENVKEQLKADMLSKKKSGEYNKLLEEMRKNTEIEKFTKNLK